MREESVTRAFAANRISMIYLYVGAVKKAEGFLRSEVVDL